MCLAKRNQWWTFQILSELFLSQLTEASIRTFTLKCGVQKSECMLRPDLLAFSPAGCNIIHLACQSRSMLVNYQAAVNTRTVAYRADRYMDVFRQISLNSLFTEREILGSNTQTQELEVWRAYSFIELGIISRYPLCRLVRIRLLQTCGL
jgi:hypothetical protein